MPTSETPTEVITFSAACGPTTPALLGTAVRALSIQAGLDEVAAAELEIAVVEAGNLAASVAENDAAIEVRVPR